MIATVRTLALYGMDGYEVQVECDVNPGLPGFDLVGLPDASVREARERVRSAARNSGFVFPAGRITVNLAPASRKKEGTHYDLPVLAALLSAAGQMGRPPENAALLGEVSLSGQVRPVRGVLPMALAARRAGIDTLFLPQENAAEAVMAGGLTVYPLERLDQLADHLAGRITLSPADALPPAGDKTPLPDFSDIKGQEPAKRGAEIAAAGGHHLLMVGPPGSGKSMIAKRLPSILPPLRREEALETASIYSVAGLLLERQPIPSRRPFRSPHHTLSAAALAGGGANLRPGEISLAHNGVLFLDELPEFHQDALEILRQPLEDGQVQISRASGTVTYPCRFLLAAAMNPCKCGWHGYDESRCRCSPKAVRQYLGRLSGPLLDRMDLQVDVPALSFQDLSRREPGESSAQIRQRVLAAREIQDRRFSGSPVDCNAHMGQQELRDFCRLDDSSQAMMSQAFQRLGLTGRSYDRILRVARTIADLAGAEEISPLHLAEALSFRTDRLQA